MRLAKGLRLNDLLGGAVAKSTLVEDLVSYWPLGETSGTRVDVVGDNDLTDNNTVGYDTGKNGNGASFVSGNTESLSKTSLDVGTTNALSLWFNVPSGIKGVVYLGNGTYSANRLAAYFVNDDLYVETKDGAGGAEKSVHTYADLSVGFHHLYLQYNGTAKVASCSLDNGELFSATADTTVHPVDRITLGILGAFAPYDGIIDEVGLWSRVLTEDERTKLQTKFYNATSEDFEE